MTGAGGSAASNFIHSLRLSGEPFHVVGTDASKYHLELADVESRYLLPRADDPDFIPELNAVIDAEEIELVHPQPDIEVLRLSARRDEVQAKLFLPAHETIVICQDKAACAQAIADAGVPAPRFHVADSADSLAEATGSILDERKRAWVRAIRGAGARASLPVTSPEQAVNWARYWVEVRGLSFADFMVSEFLPGREFAFQSLWLNGEIIVSQARERLEYVFGHLSPSGQSSSPSVARTVHRDDVNRIATECVRGIDPEATGVFCADLKEDENGTPLLTEINAGRFFTTSNFLATAGANMPYAYVQLALRGPPPEFSAFNAVDADLYWVRMIDMGFKLVREGEWTSKRVAR